LSDIPAFATPSFDTFFDPFLNAFLTAREFHDAEKAEEENVLEEDVMDQNEDANMGQLSRFRFPDPGELEAFTDLFRSTCSIAEVTKSIIPKINGKGTNPRHIGVNGSSNTIARTPPALLGQSKHGASSGQSNTGPDLSNSLVTPMLSSKKRKKRIS